MINEQSQLDFNIDISNTLVEENPNKNIFLFEGSKVRVFNIDNEIYFLGKEVATLLGYKDTISAVSTHCEDSVSVRTLLESRRNATTNTINDLQALDIKTKLIPESDVYLLTFKSHLESAKKFRKWVTTEVLPAIRKTGSYNSDADINRLADLEHVVFNQNKLISNLIGEINQIKENTSKLLSYSQLSIPNKKFTIPEFAEYINTFYLERLGKSCTPQNIIDFMIEIKMLKKHNHLPYVKFERDNYITYNFDSSLIGTFNLVLTKLGVEYIIMKLDENHFI